MPKVHPSSNHTSKVERSKVPFERQGEEQEQSQTEINKEKTSSSVWKFIAAAGVAALLIFGLIFLGPLVAGLSGIAAKAAIGGTVIGSLAVVAGVGKLISSGVSNLPTAEEREIAELEKVNQVSKARAKSDVLAEELDAERHGAGAKKHMAAKKSIEAAGEAQFYDGRNAVRNKEVDVNVAISEDRLDAVRSKRQTHFDNPFNTPGSIVHNPSLAGHLTPPLYRGPTA